MSVVRCAVGCGVRFDVIRPAGFRILAALDNLARDWPVDIEITSGTDGTHSGPADPHLSGEAYDVRSNNLASMDVKQALVRAVIERLKERATETAFQVSGGWANDNFFAFLEAAGTGNEHIHCQRRRGQVYPPSKG